MAHFVSRGKQLWINYHGTAQCTVADRIELFNGSAISGRDVIREAAEVIKTLLRLAKVEGRAVRPIGSGWSPAPITLADDGWLIETARLNRGFRVARADLAPGAAVDPAALVLCQAGMTVDELNDRIEREMGRSLRTTGASNGQTIAGACATGTHGSVLDAGGIQDHVRAMQIVTPSGIHWIEPERPLFSDDFIRATGAEPLRSDAVFAAALVNVGALGFVSAIVLETVPRYLVRVIQKKRVVSRAEIAMLARGEFRAFARETAIDEDPYFVQLIVNPYSPDRGKALLKLLYKRPYQPDYTRHPPALLGAGYDALTLAGRIMEYFPLARGRVLQKLMEWSYASGPDESAEPVLGTWGESTETHTPLGHLFNGSVTIPREELARAWDVIIRAFVKGGGGTVVTCRFMQRAAGLLAPARFAHNAVIDFDGPRSARSLHSYKRVTAALDAAGIPFARHWAKTNGLDAARVRADYGAAYDRWRAAQHMLMPDAQDRAVFHNAELARLGLIG